MRLKDERIKRDWSQARFAREAELCQSTVSQIENGRLRPYPNQLKKLAQALNWKGNEEDLLADTQSDQHTEVPCSELKEKS